jgi:hypothetical protein
VLLHSPRIFWVYADYHRHFFLSYVILQGFGIMPLQLLNLGVIIPSAIMRLFVTRTPRGVFTFFVPDVAPTSW